ncbi:MAG: HEPN domain-containing protein [Chloroflexi bacterium]|nr:HEPN domain-containing protein [Chloroflexota bacterium]
MPDRMEVARDWFAHGDHDLQAAEALLDVGGFPDTVGMLVQQAAEKYLKGFLIYHGWKLRKTHDLRLLVGEAITYEPSLADLRDFARKATAYYLEYRYPPSPPAVYSKEEMAEATAQAEDLIARIRAGVGRDALDGAP